MATVGEVCQYVRSKNAGPFWVTFDLFFHGREEFDRYANSPAIGAETFGRLFGVDPAQVKHFPIANLEVLKISCVRPTPSGSRVERDLHSGQMFARLLDIELD